MKVVPIAWLILVKKEHWKLYKSKTQTRWAYYTLIQTIQVNSHNGFAVALQALSWLLLLLLSVTHTTAKNTLCHRDAKIRRQIETQTFLSQLFSCHSWRRRSRPSEHRPTDGHHWHWNAIVIDASIHSLHDFLLTQAAITQNKSLP